MTTKKQVQEYIKKCYKLGTEWGRTAERVFVRFPDGGQIKKGQTWFGNDTVEIFKPEVKGTIVAKEIKCPACNNDFSQSVDESGTICTPDKCISTGKPIPEDTMRWMRYEMIHSGSV